MSFLQDIARKITDAGQKTIRKTKDISEISKLNSMIFEEEEKSESIYSQIGRIYASLYSPEHDVNFTEPLKALNASQNRIREFKNQIQIIQGVRLCPKCGAEVSPNAVFCSLCGISLPKPYSKPPFEICPECGAKVKTGMNFCTSCGKPMRQQTTVPQQSMDGAPDYKPTYGKPSEPNTQAPTPGPARTKSPMPENGPVHKASPAPEPVQENHTVPETAGATVPEAPEHPEQETLCPKCGEALEDGADFCKGCGTKPG